jgi:hypothetical protein
MNGWQRAFDVQMGLWHRWGETDIERYVYERFAWRANEETLEMLHQAVGLMRQTMLLADPIFVSADMCKLIEVAQESFYPEPLHASELITPCGFLFFEQPIEVWTGTPGDQVRIPYAAFCWIGIEHRKWEGPFSIALATFDTLTSTDGLPGVQDLQRWDFEESAKSRYFGWWRLAQTTFRLMQEFKPVHRSQATLARGARRRAQRVGFEPREITVVTLRRKRGLSEHLGGTANYSHRFPVSGHWRNQWYPTLGKHRMKWIAPYVKGPHDKPFIPTSRRAFKFIR